MALTDVVGGSAVEAAYQPVVSLETGQVLGFEAYARGVRPPLELLRAARAQRCAGDFDWLCRAAAITGALRAGLGHSLTLFVNVEPDSDVLVPPAHVDLLLRAESSLRVVLEVTERAVVQRPAELLRLVDWARDRSWGIALDDLGEDPSSLAMMPFLEPDVIKLDLRLVQQRPSPEIGLVMSAAMAQAERTGAVIVAEGVEDEADREAALAMGATLGQGWLYGRPGPLPRALPPPDAVIPLRRTWYPRDETTPFAVVRASRALRRGDRQLLLSIAEHLQEQALAWQDAPVVLSTFQAGEDLAPGAGDRYQRLASRGSFVATLHDGEVPELAGGVRAARLPDEHALTGEWSVVVVGPHYAGALVARQTGPDPDAYDFAVTHERQLVVEAGRTLLRHVPELDVPWLDATAPGR